MRPVVLGAFLWLMIAPRTGWPQSFDCHHAEIDAEWAICSTPELAELDERLAATYKKLSGPATTSPAVRNEAMRLQQAWLLGRRDMCGGNVGCLVKAYRDMLGALSSMQIDAATSIEAAKRSIVPRCGDSSVPLTDAAFKNVVCSDQHLFDTVRQIENQARKVQSRLKPSWRLAFVTQEAAFPQTASQCPQDKEKLASCVAKAIAQRIQDVTDLAINLDQSLPECAPSELSVTKGNVGDGGMSQALITYLIKYTGTSACSIRGFPKVLADDAKGKSQPTFVNYSGRTYFTNLLGAPLPVTLSQKNNMAWFGIYVPTACDPPADISVKVSLPSSSQLLNAMQSVNCPVTVTPIEMISTLLSSVY